MDPRPANCKRIPSKIPWKFFNFRGQADEDPRGESQDYKASDHGFKALLLFDSTWSAVAAG